MRPTARAMLLLAALTAGCGARTAFYDFDDAASDAPVAPDLITPKDVPIGPDVPIPRDLPPPPDRIDPPEDLPILCTPGQLVCAGRCVDPQTDATNCGGCGAFCVGGRPCVGGRCGAGGCDLPGFTLCAGSCVNLTSDPANCGSCGMGCGFGRVCTGGRCTPPCAPPTSTFCGDRCVDTNTNTANCGACGRACPADFGCFAGNCAPVPPLTGPVFRITSLGATDCASVEHNTVTGDDRGGIAVSPSNVFYTGDTATGRFDLDRLAGASVGRQYDAITGNLRDGQVYTLADPTGPLSMAGGTVTDLALIDGATGALTGRSIALSRSIELAGGFGSGVGIFAGYDRIALLGGGRVFNIDLPSGVVTELGAMATPEHQQCENWAFWGVAEFSGGALSLVYVRDSRTIVRALVPSGLTSVVGTFANLSDMCSFTVAPSRNRWYWHHEAASQFRSGDESIGFCAAAFSTTPPPPAYVVAPPPSSVTWIEACAASGHVRVLMNQDDNSAPSNLPFAFRYWGTELPAGAPVNVTTNGWLGLDGMANNALGGAIPDMNPPNAVLAVHWGDNFTRGDGVCIATVGAAPTRRWVVEWSDSHYCCTDDPSVHLTYEAILNETSMAIDFLYNDMTGARTQTVGVEDLTGREGVSICATAGGTCPVATGDRYRFTPTR